MPMTRDEIFETVVPLKVQTRIKAWMFNIDGVTYHIAEHGGNYGIHDQTSIWPCNKRGKRTTENPVHNTIKKDMESCLDSFIDTFNID